MSIFSTENYGIAGTNERAMSLRATVSTGDKFIEHLRKSTGENDRVETAAEKRSRENAEFARNEHVSETETLKRENTRNENRAVDERKMVDRSKNAKIGNKEPRESRGTTLPQGPEQNRNTSNLSNLNAGTKIVADTNPVNDTQWNAQPLTNNASMSGVDPGLNSVTNTSTNGLPLANTIPLGRQQGIAVDLGIQGSNIQHAQSTAIRANVEANKTNILVESILFGGGPIISQQPHLKKSALKSGKIEETDEGGDAKEFGTGSVFAKELGEFSKRNSEVDTNPLSGENFAKSSGSELNTIAKSDGLIGGINSEIAAALREAAENSRDAENQSEQKQSQEHEHFVQKLTEQRLGLEPAPQGLPNGSPDRSRLMQRIASAIQGNGRKDGTIKMKLAPEALGSVSINLRCENGIMNVSLEVETEEAKRALLDDLGELEQTLAAMGVVIESFEVRLASGENEENQSSENLDIYERKSAA